jgi:hypothetical protein
MTERMVDCDAICDEKCEGSPAKLWALSREIADVGDSEHTAVTASIVTRNESEVK